MHLITMKPAWAYNGHNYDTELEAVDAAIAHIGKDISRNHASNVVQGVMKHRENLAVLLARHLVLVPVGEPPAESLEGTQAEEPEGTREPDLAERRSHAVEQMRNLAADSQQSSDFVKRFLKRRNFADVQSFIDAATADDLDAWTAYQNGDPA